MAGAGKVPMGLHPRRVGGQTSIPLWSAPEGASIAITVVKGNLMKFTSGYLNTCTAGAGSTAIAGISTTTAHNAAAGLYQMEFVPALPGLRFEGTLEDDNGNAYAAAQAGVGIAYGMALDSTSHNWFLNQVDTTNDVANVIKLLDAVAATKPRVEFVFMASKTIFSIAAG